MRLMLVILFFNSIAKGQPLDCGVSFFKRLADTNGRTECYEKFRVHSFEIDNNGKILFDDIGDDCFDEAREAYKKLLELKNKKICKATPQDAVLKSLAK